MTQRREMSPRCAFLFAPQHNPVYVKYDQESTIQERQRHKDIELDTKMFNSRCTDEVTNSANATKRSGPVNKKTASKQEGNPDNLINNQEAIMKETKLHKVIGPGGGQTLDQQGRILTDVEEDGLSFTQESEHARARQGARQGANYGICSRHYMKYNHKLEYEQSMMAAKKKPRNGQEKSWVTCRGESKKAQQPDERG